MVGIFEKLESSKPIISASQQVIDIHMYIIHQHALSLPQSQITRKAQDFQSPEQFAFHHSYKRQTAIRIQSWTKCPQCSINVYSLSYKIFTILSYSQITREALDLISGVISTPSFTYTPNSNPSLCNADRSVLNAVMDGVSSMISRICNWASVD